MAYSPILYSSVTGSAVVKGDLLVGNASAVLAKLGVGTNDYVLTADSAQTLGIKWAAAAGGGNYWTLSSGAMVNDTAQNTTTFSLTTKTADVNTASPALSITTGSGGAAASPSYSSGASGSVSISTGPGGNAVGDQRGAVSGPITIITGTGGGVTNNNQSENSGAITIRSGHCYNATPGLVTIDSGDVTNNTKNGQVVIGTTWANIVTIGRTSHPVIFPGGISSSAGSDLTIDELSAGTAAINIGATYATSVNVGRSTVLTTVTGPISTSAGVSAKGIVRTTNLTLDSTHYIVVFNGTNLTATLPAPASNTNRVYCIKNINATNLTVARNAGGDAIDGTAADLTIAVGLGVTLWCDGTGWYIIARA
jgi:hypothetical protein